VTDKYFEIRYYVKSSFLYNHVASNKDKVISINKSINELEGTDENQLLKDVKLRENMFENKELLRNVTESIKVMVNSNRVAFESACVPNSIYSDSEYLYCKITFFNSFKFMTIELVQKNKVILYVVLITSNQQVKRQNFALRTLVENVHYGQYFYNIDHRKETVQFVRYNFIEDLSK
jgi:hypothetical protein